MRVAIRKKDLEEMTAAEARGENTPVQEEMKKDREKTAKEETEKFCKLFQSEAYGQILVKLDQDSNCDPEVRYFFKPKDLGVCSAAIGFQDTNSGWDAAEALFAKTEQGEAETVVADWVAQAEGMF